jgi:hypothetical protein
MLWQHRLQEARLQADFVHFQECWISIGIVIGGIEKKDEAVVARSNA